MVFLLSFNKALKHDLAEGIYPGNLYVAIIIMMVCLMHLHTFENLQKCGTSKFMHFT